MEKIEQQLKIDLPDLFIHQAFLIQSKDKFYWNFHNIVPLEYTKISLEVWNEIYQERN